MKLKQMAVGVVTGTALMIATAGCAQRKPAPENQQPGQAPTERAFKEGLASCKQQEQEAGVAAPTVTAQLTDPNGNNGCNCACQSKQGGKGDTSAGIKSETSKSGS